MLNRHEIAGFCWDEDGKVQSARSCKFRKTPRDCPAEDIEKYPEISVEDYYRVTTHFLRGIVDFMYSQDTYDKRLNYPELPLVLVHPKKKGIKIPMELCFFKEGQVYKKQLKPEDQARAVKEQALSADKRVGFYIA